MRHNTWKHLSLSSSRHQLVNALRHIRWPFPLQQLTVVFDAPENTSLFPFTKVTVRFSHPSADIYLIDQIRSTSSAQHLVIVSDDGEIIHIAKSHGVRRYTSDWLIQKTITAPTQKNVPNKTKQLPLEENTNVLPATIARQITEELARQWLSPRPLKSSHPTIKRHSSSGLATGS